MAKGKRSSDGLGPAERTITILHALMDTPRGASLTELVRATGIPTSTLHRMLGLLGRNSLVRETADGRYALAAGTMSLARSYVDGLDLREEALAVMRPLVAATRETCHLGVLSLGDVVYIEKVDSPATVRMYSRIGQTGPALTTAIGRAILAWSPAHVVDETIEASGPTGGKPPARADVVALLGRTRADGYARDLRESDPDICGLAAPVFDHAGFVVAGLGISVPAFRFDADAPGRFGPLVRAAAGELSHQLGWDASTTPGYGADVPMPRGGADAVRHDAP